MLDKDSESHDDTDDEKQIEDDEELLAFQRNKSLPLVKLSSVNEKDEEDIIEVKCFGDLQDNHGQMGLLSAGKESQFAKAVLKTH